MTIPTFSWASRVRKASSGSQRSSLVVVPCASVAWGSVFPPSGLFDWALPAALDIQQQFVPALIELTRERIVRRHGFPRLARGGIQLIGLTQQGFDIGIRKPTQPPLANGASRMSPGSFDPALRNPSSRPGAFEDRRAWRANRAWPCGPAREQHRSPQPGARRRRYASPGCDPATTL